MRFILEGCGDRSERVGGAAREAEWCGRLVLDQRYSEKGISGVVSTTAYC